ncbi:aspartate aminotransferase family protein [Natronosporangium hydrolyticum]|uniref:Aspartate aminotransferase family protein n=2 Tax=Natronosporangium hydrolyticum TaxID=2811111 RepID=A0A895YIE1_9ACTN|nr:aspartate aminotransferase family protein [Natronosporangium hydrolyticum]
MDSYRACVDQTTALLAERVRSLQRPYSGASLAQLQAMVDQIDLDHPLPEPADALQEVARLYLDHAVWFHEPTYLAHLNCPVAIPALSAEALLAAVNSSVDTYDQSTTGTLIEQRIIDWTASRLGFGPAADGIFTSGGTQSNLHGLLLAREQCLAGLPGDRHTELARLRVLATDQSHFSVGKAAALLGLSDNAVVTVATDPLGRLDPAALGGRLKELRAAGLVPMAVVATAGTTDLGRIDPLPDVADHCRAQSVWLHVDAAYGCGLLVSPRRRRLLDGIEQADSVTIDFHKSFFQPVSASAIVVRDRLTMRRISVHADYLNPRGAPVPNQVDKSLQTTRRFDALKVWMTLRTLGADQLGEMFDRVIDLADDSYRLLLRDADFEVAGAPTLSTVLFRYRPPGLAADDCDRLLPQLRDRLFADGSAIVAGTTVAGRYWLKFTLLNPDTQLDQVRQVLELIRDTGRALLAHSDTATPEVYVDAHA